MTKFSLFKLPLVIFCLHGKFCNSWCHGKFKLFLFYLYIFFIYKSNRYTCLCNVGKCSSFRRRVKPLWPGFLGMVFHILLVFHINFINSKCCIQYTYAIFLLTFLTLWEYQCAIDRLWKKLLYHFLRMIDINVRFNVCGTISYYNVRHIKDNIYEAKAKVKLF